MVDAENANDRVLSPEDIRAQIAEAKRLKDMGQLKPRDTKSRRATEHKQRDERVNGGLLHSHGAGPEKKPWTFRARMDLVKQVEGLAKELSEPRAKVTVAALMERAMTMLLDEHRTMRAAEAAEVRP